MSFLSKPVLFFLFSISLLCYFYFFLKCVPFFPPRPPGPRPFVFPSLVSVPFLLRTLSYLLCVFPFKTSFDFLVFYIPPLFFLFFPFRFSYLVCLLFCHLFSLSFPLFLSLSSPWWLKQTHFPTTICHVRYVTLQHAWVSTHFSQNAPERVFIQCLENISANLVKTTAKLVDKRTASVLSEVF